MRKQIQRYLVALAVATTLGGASTLAPAAGFALIEQSASGMGNAFAGAAATAEDATTVFYNPAGNAMTRYAATITGCSFDHNVIYGAGGVMADSSGCSISTNQIGANPNFVNAGSYNFHVNSGSPAIEGCMSRWKSKKPTWPIVSLSDWRSTAHKPMPSTPQNPAPVIARRQASSRETAPPTWRMTSSSAWVSAK